MKKFILQILCSATIGACAQIPMNGLIGGWPFTGNANDMSGSNNNGTVYGALLTYDRFGNQNCAYSFNGSSDYIQMMNGGPTGSVARSVSFWARTGSSAHMACFDYGTSNANGGAWQIQMNYCSPGIGVDVSDQAVIRPFSFNDEHWHHIVAILDPNAGTQICQLIFYVDGTLLPPVTCQITGSTSIMNTAGGDPITIGRNSIWFGNWFYSGDLDDFYFYDRILSYNEVLQLYNYSPTPPTAIRNNSSSEKISVYPNPASEYLMIKAENAGDYPFTITDISGRELKNGKIRTDEKINISNLKAGTYFLKLQAEGKIHNQKIIVQNN